MRVGVRLALAVLVAACGYATRGAADPYVVGNRLFPTTPTTEDPFVADEAAFGVGYQRNGATETDGAQRETDLSFDIDKRLTDDLGISLEGGYNLLQAAEPGGSSAYGFSNLEATVKYQLVASDSHEFLLSVGIEREFGATGAQRVGAEPVGSTTPTLYVGKGMGDLPDGLAYLRPLAVTGTLGWEIPDSGSHSTVTLDPATGRAALTDDRYSNRLQMGLAVEYSLRYLEGNVAYLGLPSFIDRLVPVVEFTYEAPAGRSFGDGPVGIVAPGLIYVGHSIEFAVEATVPMTRTTGSNVGILGQLTVRFDQVLPEDAGKPLFGG